MNHFGTGNAMFGAGSYKNNKYNGKELQETGMYSYGWREYMPDLGRWNGIDQLAEKYVSTSTYAYVANNPISYVDPDGRWMDSAGHIDVSGQANPFTVMGSGYKPAYVTSFMGVTTADGGGGGSDGYTFSGNGAVSMFNYFANGWDMNGISFGNGYAQWSTLDNSSNSMYYDIDGMMTGSTGGVTLNRAKLSDTPWDSYKNWADYGSGTMETMYKVIVDQRTNLYRNGYWIDNLGNQRSIRYAGRARGSSIGLRSDYLRTTARFSKYADRIGWVGYAINAAEVGYGVYEDKWRFGKNAQVATAEAATGLIVSAGVGSGATWLTGAIAGAVGGSVAPGVGTAIGFVVGAIAGYYAGNYAGEIVEDMYK